MSSCTQRGYKKCNMTIDKKHYTGNLTFWTYAKTKYRIERPEKYCVLFNTYKEGVDSFSCTNFDTLEGAMEEAKLLNEMYCNTPKPTKIWNKNGRHHSGTHWWNKQYDWDFSDGKTFWGYAILDMINCKFVKIIGEIKACGINLTNKPTLKDYDMFFRGEDEIPQDYQWDIEGEYAGWLQFRWGDGKNAIDYIEEPPKERPGHDEWIEVYDDATDRMIRKKIRVVDVPWDAPLPKREKGIYYRRPNKEPVKFPGDDYGYEEDYSMWPWSLDEEIAGDEYFDKNGGKFDNDKVGKTTMADILGDDNPLIKLKAQLSN